MRPTYLPNAYNIEMNYFLALSTAYIFGAFPTGFLLTRWLRGVDIREHGSGNPGATNVFRVVGKTAGSITLLVDALKGFLPVLFFSRYFSSDLALSGIALAAIFGHTWTIFLKFRGGKGVATSLGVFLALLPGPTLAALGVFLFSLGCSCYVSLSSILAAASLPLLCAVFGESYYWVGFTFGVAALVVFLHRKNIVRLMNGSENKVPLSSKTEKIS